MLQPQFCLYKKCYNILLVAIVVVVVLVYQMQSIKKIAKEDFLLH